MISLIKVKTVNLTQVALALNPKVHSDSNYRRLQRFFADFSFDFDTLSRFMISLLPIQKFILTLDRTNWKLGKTNINLLVLAISYKGIAFPVMWTFLSKRGNSDTSERIELMDRFITRFGRTCIQCLVADREFIGDEWIGYLRSRGIVFYLRIRANAKIRTARGERHIRQSFKHLAVKLSLPTPKTIYQQRLRVAAIRLNDEYLIIVTNHSPEHAFYYYRECWQIETLFGAFKSRGFDFEVTHLTHSERIEKLVALLAITFACAHRVGEWIHEIKPLKIKKHKRLAKSIFRYGLDYLREILVNIQSKSSELEKAIKVLSCT
ncbi:MAG: IS4 family transposase [Calditrichaeota bacterium]|nr:IS4 family transposase [Calditrichota bacterium]